VNTPLIDGVPRSVVAVVVVPTQNPAPPPGRGEEFGKASPIALVVILLLTLATFLLVRNMTKRIKRLPKSFDEPRDGEATDGEATDGEATDGEATDGAGDAGRRRD